MWLKLLKKRKEGSKKASAQALANQISLNFPASAWAWRQCGRAGLSLTRRFSARPGALRTTRPTPQRHFTKVCPAGNPPRLLLLTQRLDRRHKGIDLMRRCTDKPFILSKNLL